MQATQPSQLQQAPPLPLPNHTHPPFADLLLLLLLLLSLDPRRCCYPLTYPFPLTWALLPLLSASAVCRRSEGACMCAGACCSPTCLLARVRGRRCD